VVGVLVGVDHVRDRQALLSRDLQVDVDVPAGVDDDRLAAVAEQVGGAAKVVIQHLRKEHGASSLLVN
jgi:hypothetical protein